MTRFPKYTAGDFLERLAAGPYAWPGCYPLYFVMRDGEALSFEAAEENKSLILAAINDPGSDEQWEVIGCDVNWEDEDMRCAHTGEPIECAYPSDNDSSEEV